MRPTTQKAILASVNPANRLIPSSASIKVTIHRLLENTLEADLQLQKNQLLLLPMGHPIQNFILCMETQKGRKFVGLVPRGMKKRMVDLYDRCSAWKVKWCSRSLYANDEVMWIEVIPEYAEETAPMQSTVVR